MTLYRTGDADPPAGSESRRAAAPARRMRGPERAFATEEAAVILEQRLREIRTREERARVILHEARAIEARAEAKLAEARDLAVREHANRTQQQTAGVARTTALAARDHELARMKAKLINGETAGAELAERLRFAHRQAGKPPLQMLVDAVGYSKATLSKVFNSRMTPTWPLVRKLGAELRVPHTHVMQEWLPLWIAADEHRDQGHMLARGRATVMPQVRGSAADTVVQATGTAPMLAEPIGHSCSKCGSWVIDTAQHTRWHMTTEPGAPPPAAESLPEEWPEWGDDSATPSPGIHRLESMVGLRSHARAQEVLSDALRRSREASIPEIVDLTNRMGIDT